jgi:hypothetical protein
MRRARGIWIELIRQCEKSGLSTEEYAAKRGIPVKTLRWWIWRLRREQDEEAAPLLPVRVIPSTAPAGRGGEDVAAVEVELTDGVRLRFVGAPVSAVVEVVSRLRRC